MMLHTTRTTALYMTVLIVGALLLLYLYQNPQDPRVSKTSKTSTVSHLKVHRKPVVVDPLAASAPFATDVEQQNQAAKALESRLLHGHPEYKCQHSLKIRQGKEGTRRNYCADDDLTFNTPCLVYSFGIAYDFSFDDNFGEMGCEVFSFDPSMDTPDHRRSDQVMFYQTGLGGADSYTYEPRLDQYVKKKSTWKIRTLKSLMSELHHSNRTIDLLKVDVECAEWGSIRNMLDTEVLPRQVKQLLVEWHVFWDCPARERFQQLVTVLDDLQKAGFKSFDLLPHRKVPRGNGRYNIQNDAGYVNTRFTGQ